MIDVESNGIDPLTGTLKGTIQMIGDKSISHRAIIMGTLAHGTTQIANLLEPEDVLSTIKVFREMGISIEKKDHIYQIDGHGLSGVKEPKEPLYFGNSGTTARLLIGLLSGLAVNTTVFGDDSLSMRPMDRVIHPLSEMGAIICGENGTTNLSLTIKGTPLKGIHYAMQVNSAQVKSSLLLAGLSADGKTVITEKDPTRNHVTGLWSAFKSKG